MELTSNILIRDKDGFYKKLTPNFLEMTFDETDVIESKKLECFGESFLFSPQQSGERDLDVDKQIIKKKVFKVFVNSLQDKLIKNRADYVLLDELPRFFNSYQIIPPRCQFLKRR